MGKLTFKRRKAGTKQRGDEGAFSRLLHQMKGTGAADDVTLTIGPARAGKSEVLIFWGTGAAIVELLNKYRFVVKAEDPGGVLVMVVSWFGATNEGQKRLGKAAAKSILKTGAKMGARVLAAEATGGASEAMEAKDIAKKAGKAVKSVAKALKGETEIGRNNLQTEWELRIELVEGAPEMSDGISGPMFRTRVIGSESQSGQIGQHMLGLVGHFAIAASTNAPQAVKNGYVQLLDIEDAIEAEAKQADKAKKAKVGKLSKAINWLKEVRSHRGYRQLAESDDDDEMSGPVALEEAPA